MATVLSSNWKNLQAKIKAESASSTGTKRKHDDSTQHQNPAKKQKFTQSPKSKKDRQQLRPNQPGRLPQMGVSQSSKIEDSSKTAISPSIALWAEDNEISPESLAEAYGLGLKNNSMLTSDKDKINSGLIEGIELGKYVGIDCEMVGIGPGGYESSLARVSIVDFHGRQIYDSYVRQREKVTDWRSAVSGITPKHMRFARDFEEVQAQVAELLKGRILVGHDVRHDLDALILSHPAQSIRDTANFSLFRKYGHGRKPSLKKLAEEVLGVGIQEGVHSSIEDARVAMLLFRRHKSGFDIEVANRFPVTSGPGPKSARSKSKPTKPKRKKS